MDEPLNYELFLVTTTDEAHFNRATAILGADGVPLAQHTHTTSKTRPIAECKMRALEGAIKRYKARGPALARLENAYLSMLYAHTDPGATVETYPLSQFVVRDHA
jgi:hypothetical protein